MQFHKVPISYFSMDSPSNVAKLSVKSWTLTMKLLPPPSSWMGQIRSSSVSEQEWDRYKETPGIRFKDSCPLDWWRDRKEKFPTIAFLERQFLAAQATSAPTERIFSRASRIISQLRTRLDPTIASQTHFVAENIDWFYAELEKEGATESDNQQK